MCVCVVVLIKALLKRRINSHFNGGCVPVFFSAFFQKNVYFFFRSRKGHWVVERRRRVKFYARHNHTIVVVLLQILIRSSLSLSVTFGFSDVVEIGCYCSRRTKSIKIRNRRCRARASNRFRWQRETPKRSKFSTRERFEGLSRTSFQLSFVWRCW